MQDWGKVHRPMYEGTRNILTCMASKGKGNSSPPSSTNKWRGIIEFYSNGFLLFMDGVKRNAEEI